MSHGLVDSFGRTVRYLRLSVTDRCNLRCTYCMAEDMTFLPKSKVLSLEEMTRVAEAFVALGVQKIRLTGGEPLVRNGVVQLASNIAKLTGLRELVMTTNGVLLGQHAADLRAAGVARLNISIDSLRPERFSSLTRFGRLDDVLAGIEAAKLAGFERIKLNVVVLNGVNDDEVLSLTDYAVRNELDIAFIEEMPLGRISSAQRLSTALDNQSVQQQLAAVYALQPSSKHDPNAGPARNFQLANTRTHVGFISPMTNNFCASCNRVRITAEGQLLLCLGNEHSLDLRAILRDNPDALEASIIDAMQRKPERHEFDPKDITIMRHMSATGG
ncbi:GTP 3',8-cyclase 2 [Arenicella chitinivorans]|uniref:GTP 3',8-cyclase n=1 Tax=Arenicella chitinivorans TaxID=1329800 RepID=A0A918RSP7_9GAMM|nr:GTP 3',8-cyclase MoaA [Arenicella chitinivorans]GHA07061.1 GTP 3',8-cyclase 2 [Arenicella chitinivorans]